MKASGGVGDSGLAKVSASLTRRPSLDSRYYQWRRVVWSKSLHVKIVTHLLKEGALFSNNYAKGLTSAGSRQALHLSLQTHIQFSL